MLPLVGFYLQPAVGGRPLDEGVWRRFLEIEAVVAVKVAPFNRYQTLDVVRALAASGRAGEVALYTGNDDAIVLDLLADFPQAPGRSPVRFVGGLLGQWGVWTRRAVELLEAVKRCRREGGAGALDLLTLGQQVTDANAALFDARNGFHGCIAAIHEVLRRQGLLAGRLRPGCSWSARWRNTATTRVSITGGYVYRGARLPAWQGIYMYGDYGSGLIWGLLRDEGGAWQNALLFQTGTSITSFGEDEAYRRGLFRRHARKPVPPG